MVEISLNGNYPIDFYAWGINKYVVFLEFMHVS